MLALEDEADDELPPVELVALKELPPDIALLLKLEKLLLGEPELNELLLNELLLNGLLLKNELLLNGLLLEELPLKKDPLDELLPEVEKLPEVEL